MPARGDYHVIYNRLNSKDLSRWQERLFVNQILQEHSCALLVFSYKRQFRWHFLSVKYDADFKKCRLFRRITVQTEGGLRTAAERIAMLDLEAISVTETSRHGVQNLALPSAKPAGSKVETLKPSARDS